RRSPAVAACCLFRRWIRCPTPRSICAETCVVHCRVIIYLACQANGRLLPAGCWVILRRFIHEACTGRWAAGFSSRTSHNRVTLDAHDFGDRPARHGLTAFYVDRVVELAPNFG